LKLGISSYTYTWAVGVPGYPVATPLTVWGLLQKAATLGVRVVQVADNLPLHRLELGEVARLAESAAARGIQFEVGARGIAPEHLLCYLELAQRLASPFVRVVIDTATHHPSPDEVVTTLNRVLPRFAAADTLLAIENHDRFRVDALVSMLGRLEGPVGVCLDTVNSLGALEGPEVVVAGLAPWAVNLHVKDFVVQRADHMMGFTVEGRPAGEGQLDVEWLLAELRKAGRDCNAILELWTPPEADVEATAAKEEAWAQRSIANLRRWIRE
jgi:sugar phosphate isomerase/epimerase